MDPASTGVLTVAGRLCFAFVLALPLAWERQSERHIGLRTVPLVSVGACAYLLLAAHLGADVEGRMRVIQGLLSGIGFIGAGAILKHGGDVVGIATAATIWNRVRGRLLGTAQAWRDSTGSAAAVTVPHMVHALTNPPPPLAK